eukprot:2656659-Pyramimonas_sp.AAC.1
MGPDSHSLTRWSQLLGASVAAPSCATLAGGSGPPRCLDFFVLSRGFETCVADLSALRSAPRGPYAPVQLTLRGLSLRTAISVR